MALLKYQRNRLIIAILFLLVGGAVVLMLQGVLPGLRRGNPAVMVGPEPIVLEFWNVFENEDIYADLIAGFEEVNPHVTINYTKVEHAEYTQRLIESFADGTAPNIFTIHNTWLPLQKNRISPAPSSFPTVAQFRNIYPRVAEFDFVRETESGELVVYALPLSIETLGLFYNKDYFEAANIASPPKTWEELLDYTKFFTQLDGEAKISLSGISLGTVDNINRSTDILSLLMMQSGTRMNNEFLTEATFDQAVDIENGEGVVAFYPGRESLEFYLAFSDKTKAVYSWDKDMSYSIDAFVEGKSVMMINYPHHIKTIRSKAPHLNFAVSSVPQLQNQKEDVSYASYWGFTVSKGSANTGMAWEFINFLSSPENLKKYLEISSLPTARRDLILWQQQDKELKHFANQIVSARSWYQGDSATVENILKDMVQQAMAGEIPAQEAIDDAAARVTLIIQKIQE